MKHVGQNIEPVCFPAAAPWIPTQLKTVMLATIGTVGLALAATMGFASSGSIPMARAASNPHHWTEAVEGLHRSSIHRQLPF